MNEGKAPVPDPRIGMDAPDKECLSCAKQCPNDCLMDAPDDEIIAEALEYADELTGVQTDARGRSIVNLAAEVRRLRAEADEVYELAHKRPVPSCIASMLCNMTERHRRQGGRA